MSKNYSQVGEGCDGENPRISQKCPGIEVTFSGVFQLCCPLYESHGRSGGFAKLMIQRCHSNEAEYN